MGDHVQLDLLPMLAASFTDWVERAGPIVLAAVGVAIVLLRRRERSRGPDEDDLDE